MLRELLWRDWVLTRREILINAGLFTAFQVYAALRSESPRFFLGAACIFAAVISIVVMSKEDKVKGGAWTCSLPVSRKNLIKARMTGGWLIMTVLVALAVTLGLLLPGGCLQAGPFFRLETLFLVLSTFTLISTFLYPFMARFGFLGLLVFLIGLQVLGVVALLAVSLMPRQAPPADRSVVGSTVEALKAVFSGLRDSMPPWALFTLFLVVVCLVNWAGFKLTVALFQRREF